MAENTTADAPSVTGQRHDHPAVRRLARACIALVRWQRTQAASATADAGPDGPAVDHVAQEAGHA